MIEHFTQSKASAAKGPVERADFRGKAPDAPAASSARGSFFEDVMAEGKRAAAAKAESPAEPSRKAPEAVEQGDSAVNDPKEEGRDPASSPDGTEAPFLPLAEPDTRAPLLTQEADLMGAGHALAQLPDSQTESEPLGSPPTLGSGTKSAQSLPPTGAAIDDASRQPAQAQALPDPQTPDPEAARTPSAADPDGRAERPSLLQGPPENPGQAGGADRPQKRDEAGLNLASASPRSLRDLESNGLPGRKAGVAGEGAEVKMNNNADRPEQRGVSLATPGADRSEVRAAPGVGAAPGRPSDADREDLRAIPARPSSAWRDRQDTAAMASEPASYTVVRVDQAQPADRAVLGVSQLFDPVLGSTGPGSLAAHATEGLEPRSQAPAPQAADVLRQIADRLAGAQPGLIEISLAPEELGRLRLTLTREGEGMIVSVQAERGETLDLLRRNTDLLAQDLRALGYSSTTFDFGQWRGQGNPQGKVDPVSDDAPLPVTLFQPSRQPSLLADAGLLNLRL